MERAHKTGTYSIVLLLGYLCNCYKETIFHTKHCNENLQDPARKSDGSSGFPAGPSIDSLIIRPFSINVL
jgi:hypothetical protein